MQFTPFPKIGRLSRGCCITEKIDGTNASVCIAELQCPHEKAIASRYPGNGSFGQYMFAGSRTRWITPEDDNFGFAKWVQVNQEELWKLGPGHHYGEWWGQKIQRGYGLAEKRFSLFNTDRWDSQSTPSCCHVVPLLFKGDFRSENVEQSLETLRSNGSVAAPGFMKPEGIVVYHIGVGTYFKKTLEHDESPKSLMP